MSQEHHSWEVGKEPPPIRVHSLAKHRVLAAYLEKYVDVLTAHRAQTELRLTLIDGFAGGGKYLHERTREECLGSPLIMLNSMRRAHDTARSLRRSKQFNLDVDYFFIEKDSQAIQYLRNAINETDYRSLLSDRIRLIHGEFTSQAPSIIDFIKGRGRARRAIFVLDQFGYSEVPLLTIRNILASLKNAEVILTFATDWLIDYLNDSDEVQQRLHRIGIQLPPQSIRDAKTSPDWRRIIQFSLHEEIPRQTEAAHYTPFFIRSGDAHRDFWLIHLSGHHRARDVMVDLHWQESTSFAHFGRSGLRMLGYDPATDMEWTKQQLLPCFLFNKEALESSKGELIEQLPRRLHQFPDGVPFNEFFAQVTNESPVTADIMRAVLTDLAKDGVIEVRDKTGLTVREKGIQHRSDVIKVSRQLRLGFKP
jgi:three-Cys-motif partner protein